MLDFGPTRNFVQVSTHVNPTFNVIPTAPPDSQLPALEARMRELLPGVLRSLGIEQTRPPADLQPAPDDVTFLFHARYRIEKELRRIWRNFKQLDDTRRPIPVFQMAGALECEGLLDRVLSGAIREVYRTASPAVHGEPVSSAQVAFVREIAPRLVAALEAI